MGLAVLIAFAALVVLTIFDLALDLTALVFAGGWFIGTAPIFLAGAEIDLSLLAPVQLGSSIELKAERNLSPHN